MLGLLLWAVSIILDASGAFHLTGWDASAGSPADYPQIFAVWVEPVAPDSPPIGGKYSVEKGELVFRPRYPLQAGTRYRAVSHAPGGPTVERTFETPRAAATPATHIERVFPTTGELPENLLKFYIHFSAPMSRGESYQHIHLYEDGGQAVEPPFLEVAEELWDRDARRFTLLLEPGRIKRGLVPNREAGPPMVAGKRYTLVIDRDWHDATGQALGEEYRKTFLVLPPDRRPVKLDTWKIAAPAAGSITPLEVIFPRPLDRALLDHMISVVGINGAIHIDNDERRWQFTPRAPWRAGKHTLLVDTALEDLAGNKVDQAFDVDVFEHIDKTIRTETKSLTFIVK